MSVGLLHPLRVSFKSAASYNKYEKFIQVEYMNLPQSIIYLLLAFVYTVMSLILVLACCLCIGAQKAEPKRAPNKTK